MLDFHEGTGGIVTVGKHLGGIDMDELFWLKQNKFLPEGKTGRIPDDGPESLPYFDDVILSHKQVCNLYKQFNERLMEVSKMAEFKSAAIEKMEKILSAAVESGTGLSTIAD